MADFDRPAPSRYHHEILQGRRTTGRGVTQVVRVRVLLPLHPPDQQELFRVLGGEQRPPSVAGAFGPVPGGPPFEHGAPRGLLRADRRGAPGESHPVIAGDDHDVGQEQGTARGPEVPRPPVHLVRGDPADPDPALDYGLDLRDRERGLGRELQAPRDPGLLPARGILRPAFGHVQVEPRPALPGRGDQRGEHPGHAVLGFPGHPGMLRGHAGSGRASLQVGGLVDGQARADLVIRVRAEGLLRQDGQHLPSAFP